MKVARSLQRIIVPDGGFTEGVFTSLPFPQSSLGLEVNLPGPGVSRQILIDSSISIIVVAVVGVVLRWRVDILLGICANLYVNGGLSRTFQCGIILQKFSWDKTVGVDDYGPFMKATCILST